MDQPRHRPRVAVYCRISDDRDGKGLGVERQRQDCLARVEREGWQVVEVFTDNDVGASSKSRKPRPSYKRMLELAEAGEVDIILSYSNSRLTRRLRELEDLISLHERKRVRMRTIVSGDDDLSTADGRQTARIKASVDAGEADRISERVSRAAQQRREAGKWHGGHTPFGYVYLGEGKLGINPDQAQVLNEAARRVMNGESLYGVCQDFNRREIKTGHSPRAPHGTGWHGRTLKRVLTYPAAIGCTQTDDGTLRQVAEPILDRPTYDRLRETLYDPIRFTETRKAAWSNRRKYPLSGLLYCSLCGHTLSGSTRVARKNPDGSKRPSIKTFACIPGSGGCGHLRIDYAKVEAWVLNDVFLRINVPGVQTSLSTHEQSPDDDELRQRIADAERGLERLDDANADGLLDNRRYRRQLARLTERVDTLRTRLAETLRSTFVVDTGGRSLREAWEEHAHDVAWQRALLEHVIDRVTILPHPRGVTSTINRKRGESDEQLESRRKKHLELLMRERVRVSWPE